jgi:acyl carrier protein
MIPGKAEQAEALILELLADECDETPTELRERLSRQGPAMPIDSLELLEIVVELRKRTNLTLLTSKLTRRATKSVHAFADYIANETK